MFSRMITRYVERTEPKCSEADIRAEVEKRHQQVATTIAQRYTRGNVPIQEGAFLMKDELEASVRRRIKR